MIDTHSHIDGPEFDEDRDEVVARAREAGVEKILVPAIDLKSLSTVMATAKRYPGYAYPMIGLHPEEVKADWREVEGLEWREALCPPSSSDGCARGWRPASVIRAMPIR